MPAKTYLFYHLIFTTKYRRPLLSSQVLARVTTGFSPVLAFHRSELLALEHGPDQAHIHLLVLAPAAVPVAALVRDLKSASSRLAGHQFYWGRHYFAKSVGSGSVKDAQTYIQNQWRKNG